MSASIVQAFKNDYNQTCHPVIMQAIQGTSSSRYTGYGLDEISKKTADLLSRHCECPSAQVHFIAGGTLTNLLSVSAFLRPHQSVIAPESGHIEIHETGAIEATGHKILKAKSNDGKLTPEQIKALCSEHDNEHMVQAKLVYVSQATELGTVYTKSELQAIAKVCKELDLYLFVDGARVGAAIVSSDNIPSLADMAKICDAFYVGGTKNGALFGEALVLINEDLQKDFRYLCKQRGALLAKGWLISAQFEAFFEGSLYYDLARHANDIAKYIDAELKKLGLPLLIPTYTNQIFPKLPVAAVQGLAKSHAFETWSKGASEHVIRFVTSWGTSMDDANDLLKALKNVL